MVGGRTTESNDYTRITRLIFHCKPNTSRGTSRGGGGRAGAEGGHPSHQLIVCIEIYCHALHTIMPTE